MFRESFAIFGGPILAS